MKRIVLSSVLVFLAFSAGVEAQVTVLADNTFPTLAACDKALKSGQLRIYEPKYFGLKTRNPTNGRDRIVVPLESTICLEMRVVGGRRFVAQREGTEFRAQVLEDGSQVIYARNDCGNPVYGLVYPAPMQPVLAELVPEIVPVPEEPRRLVIPVQSERERSAIVVVCKKKGGFCSSKKCRVTVFVVAGAAGYGAYRYWYCPPGTVRK